MEDNNSQSKFDSEMALGVLKCISEIEIKTVFTYFSSIRFLRYFDFFLFLSLTNISGTRILQ